MAFPHSFTVYVERRLRGAPGRPWEVKFCVIDVGWFRGRGSTPGLAMQAAWRAWRRCPECFEARPLPYSMAGGSKLASTPRASG